MAQADTFFITLPKVLKLVYWNFFIFFCHIYNHFTNNCIILRRYIPSMATAPINAAAAAAAAAAPAGATEATLRTIPIGVVPNLEVWFFLEVSLPPYLPKS